MKQTTITRVCQAALSDAIDILLEDADVNMSSNMVMFVGHPRLGWFNNDAIGRVAEKRWLRCMKTANALGVIRDIAYRLERVEK
jgi:hypothetical protein